MVPAQVHPNAYLGIENTQAVGAHYVQITVAGKLEQLPLPVNAILHPCLAIACRIEMHPGHALGYTVLDYVGHHLRRHGYDHEVHVPGDVHQPFIVGEPQLFRAGPFILVYVDVVLGSLEWQHGAQPVVVIHLLGANNGNASWTEDSFQLVHQASSLPFNSTLASATSTCSL